MKVRLRPDWTTRPVEWDAQVRVRLWTSPEEAAALRRERDDARRERDEARAERDKITALLESLIGPEP